MKKSKFYEPLAAAVASGSTIKAGAGIVGCSVSTAYTISADRDFRQRVSELRTEAVTEAVGKLSDAASQAVDTMRELLGEAHDPPVRLNAAQAILGALGPIGEIAELRQRLDQIEQQGNGLRIAK